jgi:hypothetical protein
VKRILCYVNGTLDYGLCYEKLTKITWLAGYSHSDHAGDVDNHKSTSGNLFYLGKCPVSWQSLKQRVVALSSCEAQSTLQPPPQQLKRFGSRDYSVSSWVKKAECMELMMDSKSALALNKNPISTSEVSISS